MAQAASEPADGCDLLFYDGHCGLCHRWVRRIVYADAAGDRFRFASLHGETFERELTATQRAGLPDSIVVKTPDGGVLTRSAAIRRIVDRLGRPPGLLLTTLPMRLPRPLADALYRLVARLRFRFFDRTAQTCPTLPPEFRERFLP